MSASNREAIILHVLLPECLGGQANRTASCGGSVPHVEDSWLRWRSRLQSRTRRQTRPKRRMWRTHGLDGEAISSHVRGAALPGAAQVRAPVQPIPEPIPLERHPRAQPWHRLLPADRQLQREPQALSEHPRDVQAPAHRRKGGAQGGYGLDGRDLAAVHAEEDGLDVVVAAVVGVGGVQGVAAGGGVGDVEGEDALAQGRVVGDVLEVHSVWRMHHIHVTHRGRYQLRGEGIRVRKAVRAALVVNERDGPLAVDDILALGRAHRVGHTDAGQAGGRGAHCDLQVQHSPGNLCGEIEIH
mmetsp:Transcript_11448/g.20211  ORF Transcript_11448/g.20211 Transcript_11448/m.20211 type:complete len:299 (+) Transcript_11448:671-1567(+)